jgi:hypothetical protein
LKLISREFRNPKFQKEYLLKYREPAYHMFTTCKPRYILYNCKILGSETSQKIIYIKSTMLTCLKLISGASRNHIFHIPYIQKYSELEFNIFITCTIIYLICLYKISWYETSQRITYCESSKMTYLKLILEAFRNCNFHGEYLSKCIKP